MKKALLAFAALTVPVVALAQSAPAYADDTNKATIESVANAAFGAIPAALLNSPNGVQGLDSSGVQNNPILKNPTITGGNVTGADISNANLSSTMTGEQAAAAISSNTSAISGKVDATNGTSTGQTLKNPTITGGSATGTDISAANVTAPGAPVARMLSVKLHDYVTPEDFGAVGDGVTDDTAAITAAIASGHLVHLGPKTYAVQTLELSAPGALEGSGRSLTVVKGLSATADVIDVRAGGVDISNLTVDRAVVATAGNGIKVFADAGNVTLNNVVAQNQWDGFALGATSAAQADNLVSQFNYNNGVTITTSSTLPAAQWTLRNVISQGNNGLGYSLWAASTGSGTGENATGPTLYECASYANAGGGWVFSGDSGTYWNDLNAFHIYSSFDDHNGITFYNPGANIIITGVFAELTGRGSGTSGTGAQVGRNYATVPSLTGSGITIIGGEAGIGSIIINGGFVQNSSYQGVYVSSDVTVAQIGLSSLSVKDNGQSAPGTYGGIDIETTTPAVLMSGVFSTNTGSSNQKYGLLSSAASQSNIYVYGGMFKGNATAGTNVATSAFGAWQAAQ